MTPFVPNHYRIRICPDLATFTFSGRVEIEGFLPRETDLIELHTRELEVSECALIRTCAVPCRCVANGADRLSVTLPHRTQGPVTLSLNYHGEINDRMIGFYRSHFRSGEETGVLALTQFQESDARRAVPCIDQPGAKAMFELELEVSRDMAALSNTPVREEHPLEDGQRLVCFQPTPRMSTYLLFFAVGPFAMLSDGEDPRVRVATLPGVPAEHADLGLEFGRNALRYCEDYFRIPYPLEKMDLIAVPDFAFGAMENWGAITFRENLLLRKPGVTSRLGEERICEVIAHEVAHQWFGNLVTPAGWQYLWLNESFATYFAYKVLDHHRPGWRVWQTFLLDQTTVALERDELCCSFAIELADDTDRRVAITESTAPIIYSKGGSILRQVEGYIGADAFRDGLTTYLNRHAYANAASHHLWDALGETADKPVATLMRCWVEQPGHPVVEVRREGDRLFLRQRRFTLLPLEDPALWQIPVQVFALADGGNETRCTMLLDTAEAELELPEGTTAFKVNAEQNGFYRVHYVESEDRDALGPEVRSGRLSPADRWGLHNDLYALVLAGCAPLGEYLTFLRWYDREDELLPLGSVARNLCHAHRVLGPKPARRVAALASELLQSGLDRIGYEPSASESHGTSVLRDQILWDAAKFGAQRALTQCRSAFQRLQRGESVAADVVRAALQVGTLEGGREVLEWLQQRFRDATSEHQRIDILTALGGWRDTNLLRESLEFALDKVPARIRFVPLVTAAMNPAFAPSMWPWFEGNLTRLEGFHPMLFERVIAAVVPVAGLVDPPHSRQFLNRYVTRQPQLREVVELALEKLEINDRLRKTTN